MLKNHPMNCFVSFPRKRESSRGIPRFAGVKIFKLFSIRLEIWGEKVGEPDLLSGAGFILEFFGHRQDGIHVDRTFIVIEDDPDLAGPVHGARPAVSLQVIGNTVKSVSLGEKVNAAILICVYPVRQNVRGHKLTQTDGSID